MRRALASSLVALTIAGCGGGGDGGGPAPPQEPPVFMTPTAVRVTQPTPFAANCTAIASGATAYTSAEVEPHLAVDRSNPNHLVAAWQQDRLSDGGLNWSPASVIYDPGVSRQTIGNVVVTTPDGIVHAFFTELGPAAGNPGATEGHLAVMRSIDKGVTWSAPVRIADLLAVGTRVPVQPQLSVRAGEILAAVAADPVDGTLYAAWQDSRFSGGAHDAIALAWSADGGITWSTPARVNADPSVPAFTPTLAVLPDGTVAVTYYDFRQAGTSTYQPTDLRLALSNDRVTWRETRLAGNFDILDAPSAGGLFVGDYQGLVGEGSSVIALYSRTNNGNTSNRTDVFADRVDANAITAVAVPAGDASRKASVPEWSRAAQGRVSRHLAGVRAARLAQWSHWIESAPAHRP